MPYSVENSSPPFKAKHALLLNIPAERFTPHSWVMSDAAHKREVGDRLRQAREALGFGLREFARQLDLDHTKLSHWEKGTNYPSPLYIVTLWKRYRVTADWIYLGEISGLPFRLGESLRAAGAASAVMPKVAEPLVP